MFISWYWIVAIVVLVVGYIHVLKRNCKACRHDREAIYKGYLRVLDEVKKLRRVGQGD
ncbi:MULTISPECIES: hypothetical protein [Kosakonia]|uniref:DUF4051 domain-containing protein n=2 Tax=Kosakonia TaxID=1330547 RepID=A0A1G4XZ60_9ENTR|nr:MULTISPECIES: hypothetical protein [Kosakonia]PDO86206.1 DUF4051 domain-containing protein [Kosakonia pseudosacchari]QOV63459.1 hypothetical protein IP581_19770 [Kosakonia pseudosacchari]WBU49984.1 hypothetical protein PF050_03345 [Kosakonia pseudosacchari]SCX46390.1 Protein of unknown function [Kosakonia sacchari]